MSDKLNPDEELGPIKRHRDDSSDVPLPDRDEIQQFIADVLKFWATPSPYDWGSWGDHRVGDAFTCDSAPHKQKFRVTAVNKDGTIAGMEPISEAEYDRLGGWRPK